MIDDPDFHGEATLLGDDVVVFPYHWKSRPEIRIFETVTLPTRDTKVRTWQRFESGQLTGFTLIQEKLDPDRVPADWD